MKILFMGTAAAEGVPALFCQCGQCLYAREHGGKEIRGRCGAMIDGRLKIDFGPDSYAHMLKYHLDYLSMRALLITHGHEDHIGAIPYVLKQINTPIYATRLTLGLIKTKLEEHKLVRGTALKCVKAGDIIELGKNFKIEFIQSTHSIADSIMVAIHTPVGTVVHTGDFKVDFTPIDGRVMDFARLAELG